MVELNRPLNLDPIEWRRTLEEREALARVGGQREPVAALVANP